MNKKLNNQTPSEPTASEQLITSDATDFDNLIDVAENEDAERRLAEGRDSMIGQLQAIGNQASQTHESLSRMSSMLDDLHVSESQVSPLRDQWLASRRKPGLDLAQSVKSVKELIVSLIENVSVAEQVAQKAKTRLFPQMSAESKGRRMQAAYTSASQQFVDHQT